jgi:hypothetical protein
MLETIAISFLTVVAQKVFDSLTSKATDKWSLLVQSSILRL